MSEKKAFRKTWRHEVVIHANSAEEAKEIFESINLGRLDSEIADGEVYSHAFVEDVSFEDEEYNDA